MQEDIFRLVSRYSFPTFKDQRKLEKIRLQDFKISRLNLNWHDHSRSQRVGWGSGLYHTVALTFLFGDRRLTPFTSWESAQNRICPSLEF